MKKITLIEEIQVDNNGPHYREQVVGPPLRNDPQLDAQIPQAISISSKITVWSDTIRSYLRGSVKTGPLDENETTDNQFSDDLKVPLEGYKFATKEAEATDRLLHGIVANLEIRKSDQLRVWNGKNTLLSRKY